MIVGRHHSLFHLSVKVSATDASVPGQLRIRSMHEFPLPFVASGVCSFLHFFLPSSSFLHPSSALLPLSQFIHSVAMAWLSPTTLAVLHASAASTDEGSLSSSPASLISLSLLDAFSGNVLETRPLPPEDLLMGNSVSLPPRGQLSPFLPSPSLASLPSLPSLPVLTVSESSSVQCPYLFGVPLMLSSALLSLPLPCHLIALGVTVSSQSGWSPARTHSFMGRET